MMHVFFSSPSPSPTKFGGRRKKNCGGEKKFLGGLTYRQDDTPTVHLL
jgi:hypothetical protein